MKMLQQNLALVTNIYTKWKSSLPVYLRLAIFEVTRKI